MRLLEYGCWGFDSKGISWLQTNERGRWVSLSATMYGYWLLVSNGLVHSLIYKWCLVVERERLFEELKGKLFHIFLRVRIVGNGIVNGTGIGIVRHDWLIQMLK